MPNCVNSPILQFADDVKMFRAISGAADFQQLQADINSFVDWSIKWQLRFNVSKCNLLHLRPLHSYGEYNINGLVVSPSNLVKDLGVLIDICNKFKFHNHSSVVASKANRMLAIIANPFSTRMVIFFLIYTNHLLDLLLNMVLRSGQWRSQPFSDARAQLFL